MTPTLAPALLMGSAPPANAPPGVQTPPPSRTSKAGEQTAPDAFASLLQAATQQGTGAQSGGETAASPSGDTTSTPEDAPTVADLLAQLMALAQGGAGEGQTDPTDEQTATTLLLDRLAEAGGPEAQNGASAIEVALDALDALDGLEALMAYLVMGQPQVGPDADTALPDDLVALLQQIEADVSGIPAQAAIDADIDGVPMQGGAAVLASGAAATAEGMPDADAPGTVPVTGQGDDALVAPSTEDGTVTPGLPGDGPAAPAADATDIATVTEAARRVEVNSAAAAGEQPGGNAADTEARAAANAAANTGVNASSVAGTENAVAAATATQPVTTPPSVEAVSESRVVNAATLPGEVAETVRVAAFRGDSEVRLVLNPPELGHLDIHITRGEQGLRITLEASQSSARELIDRSLAGLHQALEARDLRVDRLEVRATDTGRGSLDTSAGGQQSGGGASTGSQGDDTPEWSPVARFESLTDSPAATDDASAEATRERAAGSVDVMA